MKAIMYHYVCEYDEKFPNFRFLDIQNFRKQLDFFALEYGFVTHEEWTEFVQTGAMPLKSSKILLTFDDALKCHYDYVFPELVKRGLWAIFYVPTRPYSSNKALDVHKIHLLCGAFDGSRLLELALRLVNEDMVTPSKRDEFKDQTYTHQVNYEGVSEFKRIFNYYISYAHREDVIDKIASELGHQFDNDDIYVPLEALSKMHDKGMIIGSHTHSHPVMSNLGLDKQREELQASFSMVDKITKESFRSYCHPYGGFHSFNNDTVHLLKQLNVIYSFNVEARDITANDFKSSKHHLPRYDCNLFKYGAAS